VEDAKRVREGTARREEQHAEHLAAAKLAGEGLEREQTQLRSELERTRAELEAEGTLNRELREVERRRAQEMAALQEELRRALGELRKREEADRVRKLGDELDDRDHEEIGVLMEAQVRLPPTPPPLTRPEQREKIALLSVQYAALLLRREEIHFSAVGTYRHEQKFGDLCTRVHGDQSEGALTRAALMDSARAARGRDSDVPQLRHRGHSGKGEAVVRGEVRLPISCLIRALARISSPMGCHTTCMKPTTTSVSS
jgi:hypothetical protein